MLETGRSSDTALFARPSKGALFSTPEIAVDISTHASYSGRSAIDESRTAFASSQTAAIWRPSQSIPSGLLTLVTSYFHSHRGVVIVGIFLINHIKEKLTKGHGSQEKNKMAESRQSSGRSRGHKTSFIGNRNREVRKSHSLQTIERKSENLP